MTSGTLGNYLKTCCQAYAAGVSPSITASELSDPSLDRSTVHLGISSSASGFAGR